MRKILYLITKSELGGAQSHVADLIEGFGGQRPGGPNQVHLATGVEGPLTERARELGTPVHLLPSLRRSINPLSDVQAVRECVVLMRRLRPDLAHAHSSKAGLIARLAGRIARVPVIFTAHGWGFSPGTPPARQAIAWASEKLAAPLGARIICVSERDRRLALRRGVGRRSTLVTIRYGLPPRAAQADPHAAPPRLVMVARFNEQKDQPTLLRAVAEWKQRAAQSAQSASALPEFAIDLIGSGPDMGRAQELARELGVCDRVSFLGDRHDVPALLSASQGFVLSTHYEGLPISIMEAMRAGLPVIATNVSGIAEEVAHLKNGLLVGHRDVQALSHALEALVASPERRGEMGRAGRRKFLDEFTLERMLSQIEAVYQQVAPARAEPGPV